MADAKPELLDTPQSLKDRVGSTGIVGVAIAALICLSPLMLGALGFASLSAAAGWLDTVALPILAVAAITIWLLVKRRGSK